MLDGSSRTGGRGALVASLLVALTWTVAVGPGAVGRAHAAGSPTRPLPVASGRVYPLLGLGPVQLGNGTVCFFVKYITTVALTDAERLKGEAIEIARELLRKDPKLVEKFPAGFVVSATGDGPPAGLIQKSTSWNTVLEPKALAPILADLAAKRNTLRLAASGWSRTNHGPVEAITLGIRGEKYYLVAFLEGTARNPAGEAELDLEITLTPPTGKPDHAHMSGKFPPSEALAIASGTLQFDPPDPAGTYTLELKVTDRISKQTLTVPKATLLLK